MTDMSQSTTQTLHKCHKSFRDIQHATQVQLKRHETET